MNPFAALTIHLRSSSTGKLMMGMDFSIPTRHITAQLIPGEKVTVRIPWDDLRTTKQDSAAYGRHLCLALFAEARARTALAVARAQADAHQLSLHIGLDLSDCVPEIHALSWETLQDPNPGQVAWGMSERLLFSRRLASSALQPIQPRPHPARSAVVAIAAPSDLENYGFSAIPVAAELERVRASLGSLRVTALSQEYGNPCSLQNLFAALRSGPDILCLIAHGRSVDGEVHLWLEDDQGRSARVSSNDLAARLAALEPATRPMLLIFVSCESAGSDAAGIPLSAIGPRLANEGIAAILAIQGLLSFDTNAVFLPLVLSEVIRDGVIDRAVSAARSIVSDRHDWWTPALWLRLPHGHLWAPTVQKPMHRERLQTDALLTQSDNLDTFRGLTILKAYLASIESEELASVNTLEAKFLDLRKKERLFGSTETRRSEFAEIIYSLNTIALEETGVSFNDLCRGTIPSGQAE